MNIKRKNIYLVLMLIVMAIIFYFSNKSAPVSLQQSEVVADVIETVTAKPVNSYTHLIFNLNIRKIAHIFLYCLLGVTACLYFDSVKLAVVVSYLYSLSDELHQYFVPGRLGAFIDTLIDLLGIMIGAVLVIAVKRCVKSHNNL